MNKNLGGLAKDESSALAVYKYGETLLVYCIV